MRNSILRVLLATALLCYANSAKGDEPKLDPLKADTADILRFLGVHAWKWTHRPPTPFKEITVRLVHFTRTETGEFKRRQFAESTSGFVEPRSSDEISIICGRKEGYATLMLSFGGSSGLIEQTAVAHADYQMTGPGDGGLPMKIGSEYMLMARYKSNMSTENKDDLMGYVAVEIATK